MKHEVIESSVIFREGNGLYIGDKAMTECKLIAVLTDEGQKMEVDTLLSASIPMYAFLSIHNVSLEKVAELSNDGFIKEFAAASSNVIMTTQLAAQKGLSEVAKLILQESNTKGKAQ